MTKSLSLMTMIMNFFFFLSPSSLFFLFCVCFTIPGVGVAFGIYLIPQFSCCRDGLVCIFVDIQQNQLNNWFVILNQDIKSRIPILGARSRSSAKTSWADE